jgi:phenylpropionate dioxygenase-like ring-hydroxylating dioxygenase large terminal subunit
MTLIIDPKSYQKIEDHKRWPHRFPSWLATAPELLPGNYVVPSHDHSIVMIGGEEPMCVSNICTHKRATILRDRGSLKSVLTCPIHKWTWNLDGKIRGARGFEKTCEMDLETKKIHSWQGHLFGGSTSWKDDIGMLGGLAKWLDVTNYRWHSGSRLSYGFDWKIFMEIFLDLYHVAPFHPGLRSLTDCKTFDWVFGNHWSCQTARFNKAWPTEPGYQELYKLYQKTGHYDTAVYGAVWLGIYPNIMIEYYPGSIVVSTVWPDGSGRCINHLDFYYEDGLLDKLPEFPDVFQKTFMTTADEDEEIGLRMQEGLSLTKTPFASMNHPVEEAGYQHFHRWLQTYL